MPEENVSEGDKELLALMEQEKDVATPPPTAEVRSDGLPPLLSFLELLTGHDLLCVFGDTGSGKSKVVSELAIAKAKSGKKVMFWDTEQGFSDHVIERIKEAGIDYRRTSVIRDIYQSIRTWEADLVIIDSATLFITGRWFAEQMEARGRLLQELQYLYYLLKDWSHRKGGMVIIVAQPVSEFGGKGISAMGDKANFYLKDSLYIDFEKDGFSVRKRVLRVFKSRTLPEGLILCSLKTTATGMEFGTLNTEAVNTVMGR